MDSWADQGSGTIIIMAWGSDRPASTISSRVLSKMPESLPSLLMTGWVRCRSSPNSSDSNMDCRAYIQLMLPRRVLISPLWAM